jgi:hypothetical protein
MTSSVGESDGDWCCGGAVSLLGHARSDTITAGCDWYRILWVLAQACGSEISSVGAQVTWAPRSSTREKTTSGAAGIGLGTTLNYLRGAAGNGRALRSSTFDAQRAPPRATAWTPQ